ncbi:hypothetical protein GW835_02800 [archaeon]|nr:hypothetical protein [archaeon]NCP79470.1 hypothetical protein [archaeon]NCP97413.1 hypothetical protein [archaeon]NCQ07237.1 hypothetical protein [archaeon]NCQ51033.1 hypothetical protein [archaeon]
MPIIKNKRNREITKTSSPTKNRFLAEKENAEKRNKALKLISSKTGTGKKSLENNINRIAAKKSLNVKKNVLEISKERYSKIKENIRKIRLDKTIDQKQKELFLNILEKQLESVKKTYLKEMKK